MPQVLIKVYYMPHRSAIDNLNKNLTPHLSFLTFCEQTKPILVKKKTKMFVSRKGNSLEASLRKNGRDFPEKKNTAISRISIR